MNYLTMKKNSFHPFQPERTFHFERWLPSDKSNAIRRSLETCEMLSQKKGVHSVNALKAAGFHYTNKGDTVRCDVCELEVAGWTPGMKPFDIHAQRSPTCLSVRAIRWDKVIDQSVTTIFSPSDVAQMSFRHQKTESMQQNDQTNPFIETNKLKLIRQRTFAHWPHRKSLSSAEMIEAGFFSCNVGDRVICLYCNLICQQWTSNIDNPAEVHQTLSPKCFYVNGVLKHQQAASSRSVNGVVDRAAYVTTESDVLEHVRWFPHRTYARQLYTAELYRKIQQSQGIRRECDRYSSRKRLSRLINARLDLPISRNLVAEGFDLSIIKSCYENQLRLTNNDFVDHCDLRIACMILQKQIKYIDGKEENIIIPSIAMASTSPQNETNQENQAIESTATVLCLLCVSCDHSQQLC